MESTMMGYMKRRAFYSGVSIVFVKYLNIYIFYSVSGDGVKRLDINTLPSF